MTDRAEKHRSDDPRSLLGSRVILLGSLTLVGMAACIGLGVYDPKRFFAAYLAAILWPWSVSIGSLALLLIQVLTGGRWGVSLWPWLVVNVRLMPLVALMFVPWFLGLQWIYPWMDPNYFAGMERVSHRELYYSLTFFGLRTLVYFAIWCGLSAMVAFRRTGNQPSLANGAPVVGGHLTAGLGLVCVILSVTWAAFDWIMSFDPTFASTLFGGLIAIGALLAAYSTALACNYFGKTKQELSEKVRADHGNLLLTFVMLWAYFTFAHFLIMWSGDLPIEAHFYLQRTQGVWQSITPLLFVAIAVVPLICLLSSRFKRSTTCLAGLAIWIAFFRCPELCWFVTPAAEPAHAAQFNWFVFPTMLTVIACYLLSMACILRWWSPIREPKPDYANP